MTTSPLIAAVSRVLICSARGCNRVRAAAFQYSSLGVVVDRGTALRIEIGPRNAGFISGPTANGAVWQGQSGCGDATSCDLTRPSQFNFGISIFHPSVQYGVVSCMEHARRWQGPSKSTARACMALHERAVRRSAGPARVYGLARPQRSLRRARAVRFAPLLTRYPASANRLHGQSASLLLKSQNGSDHGR